MSSLAFKAFQCDDLDVNDAYDTRVMHAECACGTRSLHDLPGPPQLLVPPPACGTCRSLAVTCWDEEGRYTDEYTDILRLAAAAIVIYPVMVPVAYAVLFFKVTRASCAALSAPHSACSSLCRRFLLTYSGIARVHPASDAA